MRDVTPLNSAIEQAIITSSLADFASNSARYPTLLGVNTSSPTGADVLMQDASLSAEMRDVSPVHAELKQQPPSSKDAAHLLDPSSTSIDSRMMTVEASSNSPSPIADHQMHLVLGAVMQTVRYNSSIKADQAVPAILLSSDWSGRAVSVTASSYEAHCRELAQFQQAQQLHHQQQEERLIETMDLLKVLTAADTRHLKQRDAWRNRYETTSNELKRQSVILAEQQALVQDLIRKLTNRCVHCLFTFCKFADCPVSFQYYSLQIARLCA